MSDAAEPLDLGPIRERVAAATDGPWEEWTARDPNGVFRNGISPASDLEVDICITPRTPQGVEDSIFITAARDDVPALLSEVERLRAALATARRDALTEAAGLMYDEWPGGHAYEGLGIQWAEGWLEARAAQGEVI